jgi:hypothetical protein
LNSKFLGRSHEELVRVALDAYGWNDAVIPAYQGVPTAEFADAVAVRLLALNAQRASLGVRREGPGLREAKEPGARKVTAGMGVPQKRQNAK